MASVDDRLVAMKFDNSAFEQKIGTTLGSLDKLKGSLNFDSAKSGLDNLSTAGKNFNLDGIGSAVEGISGKFSAMGVVAFSVINNITTQALGMAERVAKSFTVTPMIAGFNEYELKMGAIQTIMAGTGAPLDTVNKKLQELNAYSDKTIYSFKDMTSNISKFTNAGVSLDDSVGAIQGVANAAALSGANAEEASRAMYNFGQALGSGSVKLIDWKSIENANMSTVEFKTQLMESAVAVGTLTKSSDGLFHSLEGTEVNAKNFQYTLEEQWLSAEALTGALNNYADETTDIGKRATAAATNVKSFSQMMDTLKESVGSGWAQAFESVFGNLEQAKFLWTGLNTRLGAVLTGPVTKLNTLLDGWNALGGHNVFLEIIYNLLNAIGGIITPIKDAFRDIFPPMTAQRLFDLSVSLRDFLKSLVLTPETADKVKRIFKGLFAIISIGITVIKGIFGFFKDLLGIFFNFTGAGGGILTFFATLADGISGFQKLLVGGNVISDFFTGIVHVIENFVMKTVMYFNMFKDKIAEVFGYFMGAFNFGDKFMFAGGEVETFAAKVGIAFRTIKDRIAEVIDYFTGGWTGMFTNEGDGINLFANRVGTALGGLRDKISAGFSDGFLNGISDAFTRIKDAFLPGLQAMLASVLNFFGISSPSTVFFDIGGNIITGLVNGIKAAASTLGDIFKSLFGFIGDLLKGVSFDDAMKVVDTGLLATFLLLFKRFTDVFSGFKDISKAVVKSIEGVTGVFEAMQTKLKADALLRIAIAMGILAVSMLLIASIDPVSLGIALGAMAVGFGQLAVMMKALDKVATGPKGAAKIAILAAGLILIAGAMFILALACKMFATIDPLSLALGLTTITVLIFGLTKAVKPISENSGGLIKAGIGISAIAASLLILWVAVELFGHMDPMILAQGLLSVVALLAALAVSVEYFSKNSEGMIKAGAGIFLISMALGNLADAVERFGKMDWKVLVQGMIAVAAALVILVATIKKMPEDAATKGLGILLLAAALYVLAFAVEKFGKMDIVVLAKGLLAVGVALILINIAMDSMPKGDELAKQGLGLLLLSIGLLAIATVVKILGSMSLVDLLKGVGAFGVIIFGLAVALKMMPDGKSLALKGAGLLVVGAALVLLVGAVKSLASLSIAELITGLVALAAIFVVVGVAGHFLTPVIPTLIAFGIAMVLIGGGMALVGVAALLLAKAFAILVKLLIDNLSGMGEVFNFFVDNLTKLLVAIAKAIVEMVKIFIAALPKIIASLDDTIIAILDLIIRSIPKLAEVFMKFISTMLDVIMIMVPKIVEAGIKLLIALLTGIRDNISEVTTLVAEIIVNFTTALTAKLPDIIAAGLAFLVALLKGITDNLGTVVTALGELIAAVIAGIATLATDIMAAGTAFIVKLIEGFAKSVIEIGNAIVQMCVDFIAQIGVWAQNIMDAGTAFIVKLIEGFAKSVIEIGNAIVQMCVDFIAQVGVWAQNIMGAGTEFIVKLIQGFGKAVTEIGNAIVQMCVDFITQVGVWADNIRKAGTAFIVKLIEGFAESASEIFQAIVKLCVSFIEQIAFAITAITKAGVKFILAVLQAGADATIEILDGCGKIITAFLDQLGIAIQDNTVGFEKAGKNIVKGLVLGLVGVDSKASLGQAAKQIAWNIVDPFGVHNLFGSPSRLWMGFGEQIIEGLVIGLGGTKSLEDSSINLADSVINPFQKALSQIPDALANMNDFTPTITPVLDLTKVQQEAGKLGGILSSSPLNLSGSYIQAALIAAASHPTNDIVDSIKQTPTEIKFEQIINSPTALSTADIYRQTRNQITMAKKELAIL